MAQLEMSEFKVAVVLEKQEKRVKSWISYEWEVAAILSDKEGPGFSGGTNYDSRIHSILPVSLEGSEN